MAENPRIEELRLRVQKDPASIAFAQLAEEYRRAGRYEEAVAVCRSGLGTHPGYLSARVTLGRALLEMNELDPAETELSYVLEHAPENLSAIRGLAEICHRRGDLNRALSFYQSALALARHDPDLEQVVEEISRRVAPAPPELITDGLSFEQATAEFLAELDQGEAEAIIEPQKPAEPLELDARALVEAQRDAMPHLMEPPDLHSEPEPFQELEPALSFDADLRAGPATPPPELQELERFLEAIHSDRRRRAV